MSGQDTEAQARAHLRAAEKHASKAAEHRLAAGAYHKGTALAVTHAQAEWQAVTDERVKLQRQGVHESSAPHDTETWRSHTARHHAAWIAVTAERAP